MELTGTISTESKRTLLLIFILIVSISFVSVVALILLYNTALEEKGASLQETLNGQARLIEAIAHFDREHAEGYSTTATEATLTQVREAFIEFKSTSKTAQFILGRKVDDSIIIVARSGINLGKSPPTTIPLKGKGIGQPLRLALNQKSGRMLVPKSYAGEACLAAYQPIPILGLGIVARVDLSEIRAPFFRAGSIMLLIAGLIAVVSSLFFHRVTNPMILQLHVSKDNLQRSEQKYRRLIENLGPRLFLYTHDTEGVFTFVSPSIREVLGYTEEDFLAYFETYHTENPINDEVVQNTQKSIAGIRQPPYQVEIFHKDGSIRRLEVVESPVFDDQGVVTGVEGIAQDISDRIAAEQRLKLTQFATDRAVDAIFWMGPDMRFIYVNDKACDHLGYSREELLQLGVSDINPEFTHEKLEQTWLMIKQKKCFPLETFHQHKNGNLIPVEITANYIQYDGREYNMSIVRDITQRKADEQALMEQTLRNKLILENTHEGFIILALDGKLREANNAYCRLVKYDRNTLSSMTIADLSTLRSAEEINKNIKKIIDHGHDRFEASHRCSDGSFVDLEIIATLANVGEDQFIFSFCRDITKRRRREQKRLQEVKAQRDTLVREIHHRIKNHLHGITNLLRNQITDKPEIAKAMEPAIGQVDSIALIHGLQSRMNGGRIELAALMEAICSAVNNLTSAGILLDTNKLTPKIIVRQRDAVPVALILNELLQNAVKHAPKQRNTPEIRAELFAKDDAVTLRLTNPCAAALPKGFNIEQGLGLGTGLTLARDILPHQGARLTITGDDAQVTTEFTLMSPVVTLES